MNPHRAPAIDPLPLRSGERAAVRCFLFLLVLLLLLLILISLSRTRSDSIRPNPTFNFYLFFRGVRDRAISSGCFVAQKRILMY